MLETPELTNIFDALSKGQANKLARLLRESQLPKTQLWTREKKIKDQFNCTGLPLLVVAIAKNSFPCAKVLIEWGASPIQGVKVLHENELKFITPVYLACEISAMQMLRLFLQKGRVDPFEPIDENPSLLETAVAGCFYPTINLIALLFPARPFPRPKEISLLAIPIVQRVIAKETEKRAIEDFYQTVMSLLSEARRFTDLNECLAEDRTALDLIRLLKRSAQKGEVEFYESLDKRLVSLGAKTREEIKNPDLKRDESYWCAVKAAEVQMAVKLRRGTPEIMESTAGEAEVLQEKENSEKSPLEAELDAFLENVPFDVMNYLPDFGQQLLKAAIVVGDNALFATLIKTYHVNCCQKNKGLEYLKLALDSKNPDAFVALILLGRCDLLGNLVALQPHLDKLNNELVSLFVASQKGEKVFLDKFYRKMIEDRPIHPRERHLFEILREACLDNIEACQLIYREREEREERRRQEDRERKIRLTNIEQKEEKERRRQLKKSLEEENKRIEKETKLAQEREKAQTHAFVRSLLINSLETALDQSTAKMPKEDEVNFQRKIRQRSHHRKATRKLRDEALKAALLAQIERKPQAVEGISLASSSEVLVSPLEMTETLSEEKEASVPVVAGVEPVLEMPTPSPVEAIQSSPQVVVVGQAKKPLDEFALLRACRQGDFEEVQKHLAQYAASKDSFPHVSLAYMAFRYAGAAIKHISPRQEEAIVSIRKRLVEVLRHCFYGFDPFGNTLFHLAVKLGDHLACELLLKFGVAYPEVANLSGEIPLLTAVNNQDFRLCYLLLQYTLPSEALFYQALQIAAKRFKEYEGVRPNIFELLLLTFTLRHGITGDALLDTAFKKGDRELVHALTISGFLQKTFLAAPTMLGVSFFQPHLRERKTSSRFAASSSARVHTGSNLRS